jgi:N-acetylglucosaminyldiphosphoundecaprenol N-acetyl-beta-D-mannosaminyltransferase
MSSDMAGKHTLFEVRVDDVSDEEVSGIISCWLRGDSARVIVTPNPEFLMSARRDFAFRELLNRADLSLPDGVGVRFAVAALTDGRLTRRHTGVDTLERLARICAEQGRRFAVVGGGPGAAEAAAAELRVRIPGLDAVGIDPGQIERDASDGDLQVVADRIGATVSEASVIAIGLGQRKQERLMEALRACPPARLPALRILIGVGGAIDMLAGTKRRAPAWMRASGLEWVWRLVIEPSRARRIFRAFPSFPAVVVWDTLKSRRFLRACRAVIPEILRQIRGL